MALVVEDGTGLANAESYISVADADTYFSALRGDASVYADDWGAAATTTYGDPSPLHSLLAPTSAVVFMTTWRPYLDGMATRAEAVDVDSPNTVGLTLQCLAKPTSHATDGAPPCVRGIF